MIDLCESLWNETICKLGSPHNSCIFKIQNLQTNQHLNKTLESVMFIDRMVPEHDFSVIIGNFQINIEIPYLL